MTYMYALIALLLPTGPPPTPVPPGYIGWVRTATALTVTDRNGDCKLWCAGGTMSITAKDTLGADAQAQQTVTYTWQGMGPPSPLIVSCSGTATVTAVYPGHAHAQVLCSGVLAQAVAPSTDGYSETQSGTQYWLVTGSPTSFTAQVRLDVTVAGSFASGVVTINP